MSFIASTSAYRPSAFQPDAGQAAPAGNDAQRWPAATARSSAIVTAALGGGDGRAEVRRIASKTLVSAGLAIVSGRPSEGGARPVATEAGGHAKMAPQHDVRRLDILARAGQDTALSGDKGASESRAVKYWPKARVVPAALLKVMYPMGPVYSRETIKAGTMWVPLAKGTPPKDKPLNDAASRLASADASVPAPAARPLYGRRSADAGLERLSDHARLQPLSGEDRIRPTGGGM